ncbi:MAG: 4-hydroxybenzoate octaprenyltransferase [Bauldia sp.]|nr:4-hydroxybenzoate octaprenyltransferase [Bauldia sp.]
MPTPDAAPQLPDAARGNWIDAYAPGWLKPYARLARWDRPIGWILLLIPCWVGAALAADVADRALPHVGHLALFLVGAIAMRGAGCTWNDIVDRDLDARVARTRNRPVASGAVSVRNAWLFLVAQALVGLAVLLCFNRFTQILGLASLAVVALYPFLKRVTDWPQVGLGFAFSWGALLGWSALYGSLDWAPVVLFAGFVVWTVGYDTIYALQDREDDAIVGVRSTARLFGRNATRAIAAFYAATVVLIAGSFLIAAAGWLAYAGLAAGAATLGWQLWRFDAGDPASALRMFQSNRWFGAALFVGLVADCLATRA